MIRVEGYVFIPDFGEVHPIFGPEKEDRGRCNINGMAKLAAYTSGRRAIEEARKYLKYWKDSTLRAIELGRLKLDIAETLRETQLLREVSHLIVIAICEPKDRYLLGKYDGKHSFCNGIASELTKNNFTPFSNTVRLSAFQIADDVAQRFTRQTQSEYGARIAKFELTLMGRILAR